MPLVATDRILALNKKTVALCSSQFFFGVQQEDVDRWRSNRPYFKITLRLCYLELWPRGRRNSWRTGREKDAVGHSLGDEYSVTLFLLNSLFSTA